MRDSPHDVYRLVDRLRDRFTDFYAAHAKELAKEASSQIAIESIAGHLYEYDIPISGAEFDEIDRIARVSAADRDEIERLRALISD